MAALEAASRHDLIFAAACLVLSVIPGTETRLPPRRKCSHAEAEARQVIFVAWYGWCVVMVGALAYCFFG